MLLKYEDCINIDICDNTVLRLYLNIVKYCGLLIYEPLWQTGIAVCRPWCLKICLKDGSVQTLFGSLIFRTNSGAFSKEKNCLEPTHCFLTERRSANGWDCCVSIDIVSIVLSRCVLYTASCEQDCA